MYNEKQIKRLSRFIIVGLLFQLYPIQHVRCEPTTVSTTVVLAAYLPVLASYASAIVAACLARTHNWSKGMTSIAQEMEHRCPSLSTDIQNKRVLILPTVIPEKAKNVAPLQQDEHQPVAMSEVTAISQQDVKRFRAGLRNASNVLSGEIAQRMHDNWQKMSKPSNFEMQTVPGGIRITHPGTGLSFQASMQPSAATATQQVIDWESVIARLPQAQAEALKICKYIDEGNIEAAAQIARSSSSAAVKELYVDRVEYLFSMWSHDPLIKYLPVRVRHDLINGSHASAEFFDCILARDMIYLSLCKAWNIRCNVSQVVKDAVYAFCDITKEGQLFCTPKLINERLNEIIHNASCKDRAALVKAFYLPNGVLKDFGDHTVVKALTMPKSILIDEHIEQRRILNDLIVGCITAATKDQQQVTLRAISNMKFAFSYPMSNKMRRVLFDSADLVCKSLQQDMNELTDKFMVDAKHFKYLQTPLQFFVQTEVGDAKNELLDIEMDYIAQKKIEQAVCHEHQLEGLEHSVALVQKNLPEHALQLCYKILASDPKQFAKKLPEFITVVQERKDLWVQRDMQGKITKVSNASIKNPEYRKVERYLDAALKEFDKLPEIAPQDKACKSNGDFSSGGGEPPEDPNLRKNKSRKEPSKEPDQESDKSRKDKKETQQERKERISQVKTTTEKKECIDIVKKMGYVKIRERSEGEAVFRKGNKYISFDKKGHNGGVWKMARSVDGLKSRTTRLGTFDKFLNYIGK